MTFRRYASVVLLCLGCLASNPDNSNAATSKENVERCARLMAHPKGSGSLKGLKIFADQFNCWPNYMTENKRQIGSLYRIERWYFFKIDHHVRHNVDDTIHFSLLLIEWHYKDRPKECEFGVFYDQAGRRRLEQPYERHINGLGWQEGSRRFYASREEHRNYTWLDTANWIVVASADLIVPNFCDRAPQEWNWRSIYRSEPD